jgi:hypothetical protein
MKDFLEKFGETNFSGSNIPLLWDNVFIVEKLWQKVTEFDIIIWAVFYLAMQRGCLYNSFAICYVNPNTVCKQLIYRFLAGMIDRRNVHAI